MPSRCACIYKIADVHAYVLGMLRCLPLNSKQETPLNVLLTKAKRSLQGGRMTQYMEKMAIGDSIDVKGPLGHFIYQGRGSYLHHGHPGTVKQMSMIAGGTGITPMWQVIKVALPGLSVT